MLVKLITGVVFLACLSYALNLQSTAFPRLLKLTAWAAAGAALGGIAVLQWAAAPSLAYLFGAASLALLAACEGLRRWVSRHSGPRL